MSAEQKTVLGVALAMRHGVIPPHRHDRELLNFFADQLMEARKRETEMGLGNCAAMSNGYQELKDIAAEMRKYRDFVITRNNYPDRIDAAEERAWASHAATIEANEALRRRLVVVTERCDNVAKLRKVLMELRDHVESGTRAEIIIDTALAATADQTESEVPGGNAR